MAEPIPKRRKRADLSGFSEDRHTAAPTTIHDLKDRFHVLCESTAPENRHKRLEELLTLFRFVYFWSRKLDGSNYAGLHRTQQEADSFLEPPIAGVEEDDDDYYDFELDMAEERQRIQNFNEVEAYREARKVYRYAGLQITHGRAVPADVWEVLAMITDNVCTAISRRLELLIRNEGWTLDTLHQDVLLEVMKHLPLAEQLLLRETSRTFRQRLSATERLRNFYAPLITLFGWDMIPVIEFDRVLRRWPQARSLLFYLTCLFHERMDKWKNGLYRSRLVDDENNPFSKENFIKQAPRIYTDGLLQQDRDTAFGNQTEKDVLFPRPLVFALWNTQVARNLIQYRSFFRELLNKRKLWYSPTEIPDEERVKFAPPAELPWHLLGLGPTESLRTPGTFSDAWWQTLKMMKTLFRPESTISKWSIKKEVVRKRNFIETGRVVAAGPCVVPRLQNHKVQLVDTDPTSVVLFPSWMILYEILRAAFGAQHPMIIPLVLVLIPNRNDLDINIGDQPSLQISKQTPLLQQSRRIIGIRPKARNNKGGDGIVFPLPDGIEVDLEKILIAMLLYVQQNPAYHPDEINVFVFM